MNNKVLMKGNEAIGEAAIIAGCTHYFAYPITPQNEIPAYMARRLPEVGGTFLQAESELAAINMVFGASAAGTRVMTSSSSPGVSLKQEGISYLAGAQLPAVVVNMMRGGPGLGNIAGSQGDYWQATRGGGNGDYRTIVLGPANVQELADLTVKAFDLADRYRMVVMILGDGFLGQMSESLELPRPSGEHFEKPWALTGASGRKHNVIASLRLTPEGELERHNLKLMEIYRQVEEHERMWEADRCEDADFVLVAYGTSSRISRAAVNILRKKGIRAGLFRPISLYPFPYGELKEAARGAKQVLAVEMSAGQMQEDVRLSVEGAVPVDGYFRLGGAIPETDEIVRKVESYGK
ncbi:3-methyl-2-oxobutanoate dehydrogenase subunit VorB [Sediminispirochaeta smaragdinae]|uniref:Pyruvate flavodoxin/ferredoxin oxidoreductase domain protein n=1 Tax=Sediminispirochaeta smaragdinae (strain DSM 11293 / JCM 15392 / SEBR 4228) TaxID=573413 RepID=E1RBM4_SEDSS|nr:3-methyl-2-oxobutanoate dehydrogenase subunit VorB [Sediminispirochaeta smaragdinae]ADK79754.1 pyruvate flavodoxin/ferredoxin oxidoreductase domain protein [Sediminispirochaeta smaragdinae DSM 11293]